MRIFFIVVMGTLVADFLAGNMKRVLRIMDRATEKEIGMTEDELTAKYMKEHPRSWFPYLSFLWLLLVVVGFLWAVL